MNRSIKFKVFALISIVAVVFVCVISLMSALFYDDYYLFQKKDALRTLYTQSEEQYDGEVTSVQKTYNKFENKYGIRVRLVSGYYLIYDTNYVNDKFFSFNQNSEYQAELSSGLNYAFNQQTYDSQGYCFMTTKDSTYQNEYVCLMGSYTNGDVLVASIPVAMLEENVSFGSFFTIIASLFALIVCLLLAIVISGRFTKPIIELSDIATSMATLDFSKKYTGQTKDEIGQLGENINKLSYQLDKSINELQSANKNLKEEIKQKEKIDNMRRDFIINASHELKTPVSIIQGYAEGLLMGINSEEDKNLYCETIIDEAQQMNKIVMQLLELSKIELGNNAPKKEMTDLDEMTDSILKRMSVVLKEKNIEVKKEELGSIVCDKSMIEQVLTNFLSNAFYHTQENGRISIYKNMENGLNKICVYNDGEKIPEDAMELIWEKFYKIDKSHTRAHGGTGIGLSIVKAIAIAHNGGYGVRNLESGVEFYILIP